MNESDLAFLRRLLARYDGDVQVVGGELHVSPRGEVRRGAVELALHSQLRRATVLADLSHQVSEVTVTGWDPARGARVTGRSTGAHRGPGRGRAGADLLSGAAQPALAPDSGTSPRPRDDEAGAIAEAAFDERQRRFVTVDGTAEGNPAVRVGTHVTLTGLGCALQQHLLRHTLPPPLRCGARRLRNGLHRRVRLPRQPMTTRARQLFEIPAPALLHGGYLAEVIDLDDPETDSRA